MHFETTSRECLEGVFRKIKAAEESKIAAYAWSLACGRRMSVADVEDVCQEVWLRFWAKLQQGLIEELTDDGRKYARCWLFVTTRNVASEHGSRARRLRQIIETVATRLAPNFADKAHNVDLCEVIDLCPGREREVARLLLAGWSIREIALLQRVNRATIYRRICALRSLLQRLYGNVT